MAEFLTAGVDSAKSVIPERHQMLDLNELFPEVPNLYEFPSVHAEMMFRTADVLLTGAVLGGGSDGLHQLVSVFTNYMQSAAAWAKRRKPEAEGAG